MYQYFVNTADADVEKFLRAFTLLEISEIESIVAQHVQQPELRYGQRQLANYVIQTLFGKEAAQQAEKISEFLFGERDKMELLSAFSTDELQALARETRETGDSRETGDCRVQEDEIRILELLVLAKVC